MFSATFPPSVQNLAMQQMVNHIFVATGVVGGTNPDVEQRFIEKKAKLADDLRIIGEAKTIVFVDSKKTADCVASYLSNDGFKVILMSFSKIFQNVINFFVLLYLSFRLRASMATVCRVNAKWILMTSSVVESETFWSPLVDCVSDCGRH